MQSYFHLGSCIFTLLYLYGLVCALQVAPSRWENAVERPRPLSARWHPCIHAAFFFDLFFAADNLLKITCRNQSTVWRVWSPTNLGSQHHFAPQCFAFIKLSGPQRRECWATAGSRETLYNTYWISLTICEYNWICTYAEFGMPLWANADAFIWLTITSLLRMRPVLL